MKKEYAEAFTEVYEVFQLMPKELLEKIPNKFYKMIEEEKSNDYFPNIQEPIEKQKFKNETIIILGLIYRDLLCSNEEKIKLQKKDSIELNNLLSELENEKKEKYNVDNLFKNQTHKNTEQSESNSIQNESTAIVKYHEPITKRLLSWFKSLLNKF